MLIKGIKIMASTIDNMIFALRPLGQNKLERMYMKLYRRYADCYGIDVVTLEIVKPSALEALRAIWYAMYGCYEF